MIVKIVVQLLKLLRLKLLMLLILTSRLKAKSNLPFALIG